MPISGLSGWRGRRPHSIMDVLVAFVETRAIHIVQDLRALASPTVWWLQGFRCPRAAATAARASGSFAPAQSTSEGCVPSTCALDVPVVRRKRDVPEVVVVCGMWRAQSFQCKVFGSHAGRGSHHQTARGAYWWQTLQAIGQADCSSRE